MRGKVGASNSCNFDRTFVVGRPASPFSSVLKTRRRLSSETKFRAAGESLGMYAYIALAIMFIKRS